MARCFEHVLTLDEGFGKTLASYASDPAKRRECISALKVADRWIEEGVEACDQSSDFICCPDPLRMTVELRMIPVSRFGLQGVKGGMIGVLVDRQKRASFFLDYVTWTSAAGYSALIDRFIGDSKRHTSSFDSL